MKLFDLYHLNLSVFFFVLKLNLNKFPFFLDDIFDLIPLKINRLIVLKAVVDKLGTEKAPY